MILQILLIKWQWKITLNKKLFFEFYKASLKTRKFIWFFKYSIKFVEFYQKYFGQKVWYFYYYESRGHDYLHEDFKLAICF